MDPDLIDTIPPPRLGTGTVLLVDDQGFVRRTLALALREHGFDVLEASDVDEAIRIVGQEPAIRAILTDLVLPDGSGMDLLRHSRSARPEVPVVLMSGYVVDHDVAQAHAAGALACLSKPFRLDQLVPLLCRAVGDDPLETPTRNALRAPPAPRI